MPFCPSLSNLCRLHRNERRLQSITDPAHKTQAIETRPTEVTTGAVYVPSNQAVFHVWTDFGQRQVLARRHLSTDSSKQQTRNVLSA